jgi:CRP-like cAMP-binding protein
MRVTPVLPHIQEALLEDSSPRIEPTGVVLFRRGQPAFGIFLVRTGSVSLQFDCTCAMPLDSTAGPGSILGLPATLSGSAYSLTAVTQEQCHLAFIERNRLLEILRNNTELCMELLGVLGEEVISARDVICGVPTRRHRTS